MSVYILSFNFFHININTTIVSVVQIRVDTDSGRMAASAVTIHISGTKYAALSALKRKDVERK